MKTRYSSLVSIKKDAMQKSEGVLQEALATLHNAEEAYADALRALQNITTPQSGKIVQFLSYRQLLDAQRRVIEETKEWVSFAGSQVKQAQESLKKAMMEYEKFNYLEVEEIKRIIKQQKLQEAKDLDEIALLTFTKKSSTGAFL